MPDFCLYIFGKKAAEDLWQRLPETLVLTGSLLPRYVLLCTFYSLNTVLTGSLLPSSSLADSWWPLYSPNFAFWASWTQHNMTFVVLHRPTCIPLDLEHPSAAYSLSPWGQLNKLKGPIVHQGLDFIHSSLVPQISLL